MNSPNGPNSLYAALGITAEANAGAIEAAFNEREQELQGNTDARALVRVAYDTLRHSERRAAYDRKLEQQLARSESVVGEYQEFGIVTAVQRFQARGGDP